jgi:hypothetical protein
MNGDVEELIRDGLDRLTAEVRPPAGLLGRARARQRRRTIAARSALACVAAAVAGTVVAVTVPGAQPGTGGTNARTTAYVVSRVENALAGENFVMQGRGTGTFAGSVHGHRYRYSDGATDSWTYGIRNRMEEFTGRGCGHVDSNGWCTHHGGSVRFLAGGTALIHGKLVSAYVTYFDHRYSLSPLSHYQPKPCSRTAQLVLGGPAVAVPNWPAFIKGMLRCNRATVTGHARIGGVRAIVISGSIDVPLSKGYAHYVKEARVRVGYTLYVDAKNYLPVRMYGSTKTYGGANGPSISAYVTDVRWLRPTSANIARALVTIPHGYQQVSSPAGQQPGT